MSFRDGKKGIVTGAGKIRKSETKTLKEVYYVDGLKHIILSISQLCDKGNMVNFSSAGCKVKKQDTKEIVLIAKRNKNMYKGDIIGIPGTNTCLSAIDCDFLLWHQRLGHASVKQVNKLASKDMIIGLPKTKFKDNKVCSRGKQVRRSFKPKD